MNTLLSQHRPAGSRWITAVALTFVLLLPGLSSAHEPDYTANPNREDCTFTTTGSNPYLPLWPGYTLLLEGENEDDEGELVEISSVNSVLAETEMVDGVLTRVLEERESEDGDLVEVSRNFLAVCRETGDVWYFGEDVDDIEDGEIVGHAGTWRAGVDGAQPGILMPGSPMIGARFFEEIAPGIAEDQSEILSMDQTVIVPAGTFENVLTTLGTSALNPEEGDEKAHAHGVGQIKDQALELVEIILPPCLPDATTHCLNDGRFKVTVEWETADTTEGVGNAVLPSAESGEFWFFNPGNTELLVKVLDGCNTSFNSFWVFAAGLTNIEVTLTVTDTQSGQTKEYDNPQRTDFAPILDTSAFATCP